MKSMLRCLMVILFIFTGFLCAYHESNVDALESSDLEKIQKEMDGEEQAIETIDDNEFFDLVPSEEEDPFEMLGIKNISFTEHDDYHELCDEIPQQQIPQWQVYLSTVASDIFAALVRMREYSGNKLRSLFGFFLMKNKNTKKVRVRRKVAA